ncbi:MAG: hypothetical protein RR140_00185 [Clostridia bacterium]
MKKIKMLLAVVLMAFMPISLYACVQNRDVNFNTVQLTISTGEFVDLAPYVENGIENIVFKSMNQNIVFITPQNQLAGRNEGSTFVEARCGENKAFLTVVVESPKVKFLKPSMPKFDAETNKITWPEVFAKAEQEIQIANSYEVSLITAKDTSIQTVLTNFYVIEGSGAFSVKVRAIGAGKYLTSEWSDTFNFSKSKAPTLLAYNDDTSTLSWNGEIGENGKYVVEVNNIKTETKQNFVVLNLNEPILYNITVVAYHSAEQNVKPAKSEILTLKRLTAPKLKIENGAIVWDNNQIGTSGFKLFFTKDTITTEVNFDASVNSTNMKGFAPGQYTAQITSSGSIGYLASKNISRLEGIEKLAKPVLTYDGNIQTGMQIKVVLTIKNANGSVNIVSTSTGTYQWVEHMAGTYEIVGESVGDGTKISSDPSEKITIIQLYKPSGITHTHNENGESVISYSQIQHASVYEIKCLTETWTSPQISQNLGSTNVVFKEAKVYEIFVTAKGVSAGSTYILPATERIVIRRLANIENLNLTASGVASWTANSYSADGYLIELYKDGGFVSSQTVFSASNSFNFEYGAYEIKVKAKGNNSNLIESLDFVSTNVEVFQKLESPSINFDRNTQILTINPSQLATSFSFVAKMSGVSVYTQEITAIPTAFSVPLSAYLQIQGSYQLEIIAKNSNRFLLNSNEVVVKVVKLNAPTSVTITQDERLEVATYVNEGLNDATPVITTINNIESSTLAQSDSIFEIKVFHKAKTTKHNDVYYLDSKISTFSLSRVQTPESPTFSNQTFKWQEAQSNFVNLITVSQNLYSKTFEIVGSTQQAEEFLLNLDGINKYEQFSVIIKHKIKTLTVNAGQSGVVSSLSSSPLSTVAKLYLPGNVIVVENGLRGKITWNAVQFATSYNVFIYRIDGGMPVLIKNSASQTITDNTTETFYEYDFADIATFKVQICAISQVLIYSDKTSEINVTRLDSPKTVDVSESQVLTVPSATSIVGVEKTNYFITTEQSLEGRGLDISSCENLLNIQFKFIAVKNISGSNFYLSSKFETFKFERIETMLAPTFNLKKLNWVAVSDCDMFTLNFMQNSVQKSTTVGSSVLFFDFYGENTKSVMETIMDNFAEGNVQISIKPIRSSFTANFGQINRLSAKNFSQNAMLTKLAIPTITSINADNTDLQKLITINWSYLGTGTAQPSEYEVYIDGNAPRITTQKNLLEESFFQTAGNHSVCVKAIGDANANVFNSAKSESVNIVRLFVPTALTINKDATFSFSSQTAARFIVTYNYSTGATQTLSTLASPFDMSNYFVNAGDAFVKVRAIGNGTTTLSSDDSATMSVKVLASPEILFDGTKLKIKDVWEDNANVMLSDFNLDGSNWIKLRDNTKLSKINQNYEYVFPQDLKSGDVKFEAIAVPKLANGVVKSQSFKKQAIKLVAPTGLNFVKTNKVIYFKGDIVSNALGYGAVVGSQYFTECIIGATDFSFSTQGVLSALIPAGNFNISAIALGGEKNGEFYINSNVSTEMLRATKLSTVTNFAINNGVLSWSSISGAVSYCLKIDATERVITTLSDPLDGIEKGQHTLNISAVGNITSTPISLGDIFLDGNELSQPITAFKLNTPTAVVQNGFLTINEDNKTALSASLVFGDNLTYLAKMGTKTFELNLSNKWSGEKDLKQFIPNEIYQINEETLMTLSVQVKSSVNNIIYSNFCAELSMKILANPNINASDVHGVLFTNNSFEENYDLSKTFVEWKQSSKTYGYRLLFGQGTNYMTSTVGNQNNVMLPNHPGVINFTPGDINFRVCAQGGNSLETGGFYYINSKYSPEIALKKLDTTTMKIENGRFCWNAVAGASGYYVYSSTNKIDWSFIGNKMQTQTSIEIPSSSTVQKLYFSVMAVSTNPNTLPGYNFGFMGPDGKNFAEIILPTSPRVLDLINGSLVWSGIDADMLTLTNGGAVGSPFYHTLANVATQNLKLSFSANGLEQNLSRLGCLFLDLSDQIKIVVEQSTSLKCPKINGWPTTNILFDQFANSVNAGEYTLKLSQIGNSSNQLNSSQNIGKTVYVPHAPVIEAIYDTASDTHFLQWSKVDIPTKFAYNRASLGGLISANQWNTQYILLSDVSSTAGTTQTQVPVDAKYISFVDTINKTQLRLNLTSMVEDGIITPDHKNVYLVVAGDSQNVLNGKTSNIIETNILPVVANLKMNKGLFTFESLPSASGVEIKYLIVGAQTSLTENEISGVVFVANSKPNSWACQQLKQGRQYTFTIRAIGTKLATGNSITISGKTTNAGKIEKLLTPTVLVTDGVFNWQEVANASGYQYISSLTAGGEKTKPSSDFITNNKLTWTFEGDAKGLKFFEFMCNGDELKEMGELAVGYANSQFTSVSADGEFKMSETTAKVQNGTIVWDANIKRDGGPASNFKLTFKPISNPGASNVVFTTTNSCDCSTLIPGKYSVVVQAYVQGVQTSAITLISVESKSILVDVLPSPENIIVGNGEISWRGNQQNCFELVLTPNVGSQVILFSKNKGNVNSDFTFAQGVWTYSGIIDPTSQNAKLFTLKIRAVSESDIDNKINSKYTNYASSISQIKSVGQTFVKNEPVANKYDTKILWNYVSDTAGTTVQFVFAYKVGDSPWNSTTNFVSDANSQYYILLSSLQLTISDQVLLYKICVVPTSSAQNLLRSAWTPEVPLTAPVCASEVKFNQDQMLVWNYANVANINFIVEDNLVNNEGIVLNTKTYIVPCTEGIYNETTKLMQYSFSPEIIGKHKLNIRVALANETGESEHQLLSTKSYVMNDEKTVVEYNLFTSGSGTTADPYLIETDIQFSNILKRMSAGLHLNKENGVGFTFKIQNSLNVNAFVSNLSFNGVLLGNNKTITVNLIQGTNALFEEIGINGIVKDATFVLGTKQSQINFAVLSHTNNGLISNCIFGNDGSVVDLGIIKSDIQFYRFAFASTNNNGIITGCTNKNSVTLTQNRGSIIANILIGMFSSINKKTIKECGNYGNVTLNNSTCVTFGGIVGRNEKGIVSECVSRANITLTATGSKLNANAVNLGGIVGMNGMNGSQDIFKVSNCIVEGLINVPDLQPYVVRVEDDCAIGGLVGKTFSSDINNSFTQVNFNATSYYPVVGNVFANTGDNKPNYYIGEYSAGHGGGAKFNTTKTQASDISNLTVQMNLPVNSGRDINVFKYDTIRKLLQCLWEI